MEETLAPPGVHTSVLALRHLFPAVAAAQNEIVTQIRADEFMGKLPAVSCCSPRTAYEKKVLEQGVIHLPFETLLPWKKHCEDGSVKTLIDEPHLIEHNTRIASVATDVIRHKLLKMVCKDISVSSLFGYLPDVLFESIIEKVVDSAVKCVTNLSDLTRTLLILGADGRIVGHTIAVDMRAMAVRNMPGVSLEIIPNMPAHKHFLHDDGSSAVPTLYIDRVQMALLPLVPLLKAHASEPPRKNGYVNVPLLWGKQMDIPNQSASLLGKWCGQADLLGAITGAIDALNHLKLAAIRTKKAGVEAAVRWPDTEGDTTDDEDEMHVAVDVD